MRLVDFEIVCVSYLLKSECQCVLDASLALYLMEVPTKSRTELPKYCNAKASRKKELMFVVCYCLFYCFTVYFSFKESKN